jgi:hypothetical protein
LETIFEPMLKPILWWPHLGILMEKHTNRLVWFSWFITGYRRLSITRKALSGLVWWWPMRSCMNFFVCLFDQDLSVFSSHIDLHGDILSE